MNLINKLLKICFACLLVFTPLIVFSGTSELFEFNKLLFIYICTILIIFLWALKMIINKRIVIRRTFFDIPILFFYLSQLFSTIYSIDRHTSLFGYYGRFNGGLMSLTAYILLSYAFVSNLRKEDVINFLKLSLITSVIVILWGLPGRFGHDLSCLVLAGQFDNSCWTNQFHPELRMFSTLGQPNWLGAYLAINFFIGIYFYVKVAREQGNKLTTSLCLIYLSMNLVAILFTRSRSSYLALVVGIIVFVFFIWLNHKQLFQNLKSKKTALFFVICLLLAVIFKTGIPKIDGLLELKVMREQSSKATSKQSSKINITESFDIRKVVWKGAVDLGLKYPFFGSGVETFAYAYYFTRPVEHNLTSEWDYLYNKAHNEYLNYFATTGFVGLISYLIFIIIFIIWSIRHLKNGILHLSLFISWLTILLSNFFGFSVTSVNIYFYLMPAMMIVLNEEKAKVISFNYKINKTFSLIILTVATLYLLLSCFLYWFADLKYAEANKFAQAEDYKSSAQLLLIALQMRNEHVYKDKLSSAIAYLAFASAYGKDIEQSKKLIALSKEYNDEAIKSSPKNVLYYKTKAKNQYLFYSATLNPKYIEVGIKALDEAAKLSPTDPKNYYSLAIYYSLLFDEEKDKELRNEYKTMSLKYLAQMMKIKPDFTEGLALHKQLLKKYDKQF